MPAIATRNIQKTYGKGEAAFTALNNVSLAIQAGESVAIVGKSGSGKSTLLHILALLDKPTSGSVELGDTEASQLTNKQLGRIRNKRYGFVFQQFFLNDKDTVLDNVILPLKIAGVKRAKRILQGMAVLKAVELDDKARNRAGTLSGGQKQRVCIARALINEPSIIFADEPTGNLDSSTSKVIEDLLFSLNKKHAITLIIVTHDEGLAARCDRQIRVKDGELVARSKV